MSAPATPVAIAAARQREAADPAVSAWVQASAGSGKTRVLTDRILRLLLEGAAPESLVCLTYTRAAAAEMANRLNAALAEWARLAPPELARRIAALTGRAPDGEGVRRAQQLLAATLDAPGGMRIGTLHSFAQALLRRFPLEAGVPAHFAVLDEADQRDLLRDARESVLAEAAGGAGAGALDRLARRFAPKTFNEIMKAVMEAGQAPWAREALLARFGLPADATAEGLLREAVAGADEAALRRAAAALAAGSATEQERAAALHTWLAADTAARIAAWRSWYGMFITGTGTVNQKLVNKATETRVPGTRAGMEAEGDRLLAAQARIDALEAADITGALATLAAPTFARFRDAKAARGALDYDDLIAGAQALLKGDDADWVRFRLDGGLDHLLIDEAQDTSPAQWAIVRALSEEFFAGESAREVVRTIFAVGDLKQSIFSFQGASPTHFAKNGACYAALSAGAGRPLAAVTLPVSFRSTEAVLRLVQEVEPGWGEHLAARAGQAGSVEVWPPFITAEEGPDGEEPPSPEKRCAEALAKQIASWVGREMLPARGRTMRAGDILVLVRTRKAFLHALVAALEQARVPVAGADRLRLTDSLAVQDCLAFLDALLLPEDDLNLAAVLKGPFCALAEDSLMALALERGDGRRLIAALRSRAGEREEWRTADALIEKFRARADFADAHALLGELLDNPLPAGPTGREALLARLGPEAADPLDELLRIAQADSLRHPPSLQGFLHRLRTANAEVRRDADARHDAVRIMTVHGAKGLQAPVVVLAETTSLPKPPQHIVMLEAKPAWLPAKAARPPKLEAAAAAKQQADREEYARLLYVALTRAEDRLIVVGWHAASRPPNAGCWYSRVDRAIDALAPDRVVLEGIGTVKRISGPQTAAPVTDRPRAPAAVATALPAWASPAPAEARTVRRIKPSGEDDLPEPPPAPPPFAEADRAGLRLRRGDLTHLLLQYLPTLVPAAREMAAAAWLARHAADLDPALARAMASEVLSVLALPEAAAFFDPAGLAEAPIVGEVAGRPVNGVVDRLVVRPDRVLLCDFKTDRAPPARPEDAPGKYLRQLAIYRHLLGRLFAPRPVEAALVWTATPAVMRIPPALLETAALVAAP